MASVRAIKVIYSVCRFFFAFKFDKINSAKFNKCCNFLQLSKSTFHFLLHNYTAHLSNVLKLSRRFATQ